MDDWLDIETTIDPRKITEYLLAPGHPRGGSKAEYFGRFGFLREHWQVSADALLQHRHAGQIVEVQLTIYGEVYVVEGTLSTPDGRNPFVRSVWRKPPGQPAKLVTAYPAKGGATNA